MAAKKSTKTATVALIVHIDRDRPALNTILSDEHEIEVLEAAVAERSEDPLAVLCDHRQRIKREEEEFGDYVEDLLSQPFLRKDVQDHGVQWLKSKLRIEEYQKAELDAARVIADYAYTLFEKNRELKDFFLTGPNTRVRIRIFVVPPATPAESSGRSKAA